jgi:nucleotide-binding universal stress UspA family protein
MRGMDGPLVIGFDGSDSATHALRSARTLLQATHVVVVTIWEPALAAIPLTGEGVVGIDMPLDPESAQLLDDASERHSRQVADAGVALATELGFTFAEAVPLADELNVSETLCDVARDRSAAAIVVGSRGHGALHNRLIGSTSTKLLSHAPCPVVVVPPK